MKPRWILARTRNRNRRREPGVLTIVPQGCPWPLRHVAFLGIARRCIGGQRRDAAADAPTRPAGSMGRTSTRYVRAFLRHGARHSAAGPASIALPLAIASARRADASPPTRYISECGWSAWLCLMKVCLDACSDVATFTRAHL